MVAQLNKQRKPAPRIPIQKRYEIISLHTHGFSLCVIAKKVRTKKSTAFNIIKHFKQHGSVELEKPSGWRSTWDWKDVYRVNTWIKADPTITAEELMEKFHVRGVLVLFLVRCMRFCTY